MEINFSEYNYLKLSSLGSFYPLEIYFDDNSILKQLENYSNDWRPYNKSKPGYKREGLSLFSLDGKTDGEIDLNSVREYNIKHNTNYDEMSFNRPTEYWKNLKDISEPLRQIEEHLGRSHLIKFQEGGFFPPHRDIGDSFRLISFFNCSNSSVLFTLDDKKVFFDPNRLYFADTRKTHSLVSFQNNATILVLNVHANERATEFILNKTLDS